jgi:hypothetical protein
MNTPETYVTEAYNRMKNSPSPKMSDNIHKFVCDCVGLLPASYGPLIQNKVIKDLNVVSVKSDEERGDFRKNKTYFEFKSSFLSKGTSYSITNIRKWHNFDDYVLCLIDVVNNFTPNFYVITKSGIDSFTQRGMNGTFGSNMSNTNVGMRVTLNVKSKEFELFKSMSLLKDTSFESLNEFVSTFKMKKDKPQGLKFKFMNQNFDSDNVTENYINFLKYFITLNSFSEFRGLDIIKSSLGSFCTLKKHELSPCSKKKKQFVKMEASPFVIYVSTYTSTQKKKNHIKNILNIYNSGCKHPINLEFL